MYLIPIHDNSDTIINTQQYVSISLGIPPPIWVCPSSSAWNGGPSNQSTGTNLLKRKRKKKVSVVSSSLPVIFPFLLGSSKYYGFTESCFVDIRWILFYPLFNYFGDSTSKDWLVISSCPFYKWFSIYWIYKWEGIQGCIVYNFYSSWILIFLLFWTF